MGGHANSDRRQLEFLSRLPAAVAAEYRHCFVDKDGRGNTERKLAFGVSSKVRGRPNVVLARGEDDRPHCSAARRSIGVRFRTFVPPYSNGWFRVEANARRRPKADGRAAPNSQSTMCANSVACVSTNTRTPIPRKRAGPISPMRLLLLERPRRRLSWRHRKRAARRYLDLFDRTDAAERGCRSAFSSQSRTI